MLCARASALVLASLLAASLQAQEDPVAFMGARLLPIAGPPVPDGVLVIREGRILALGPRGEVPVPGGATVREMEGRVIMPGLVCTHSHVGRPSGGDRSGPLQPGCRVLDAIDVRHAGLLKARAGGLTTLNVMPGSGHLCSGQTVYLKLRQADTIDEMLVHTQDGGVAGGLKMANGTNPQGKPPFPGTRARAAALVRQMFLEAREYGRKKERAEAGEGEPPDPDLGKEALLEVLAGKRVVHHHTHRHDDILTVLRLAEEFGFRVVLHHVSEGWKVAEEIAAAGAPCSIILIDSPGGKQEAAHLAFETGAVLERAGVLTAFHTDDPITDSRLFLRSAALAVRGGMSRKGALEGLTLAGARMLDLQDRIGTLEPGKDADLAVLSDDPLSVYTKVLETWVEGRKVFDRSRPEDRLLATGGFGAGARRMFTGCCFGPREEVR